MTSTVLVDALIMIYYITNFEESQRDYRNLSKDPREKFIVVNFIGYRR